MDNKQGQQENLIYNMPDGFAYFHVVVNEKNEPVDYICLQINPAFSQITGFTEDLVVGQKVSALYPGLENLGIDWLGIYSHLAKTGKPIELEQYFGLFEKWYAVTAYLDQPQHVAVIIKDIDARKKAEEALQAEQQEKELILNNLAEQVAFIDSEMRIIWANSQIIERHNLYDVDYKGQKCFELYHQLDQPCPDCPVVEAFKTGKTCSGVHHAPDNIYWQVTGIPVRDQNGGIIGVMDTALDITDLITSRQKLKESEAFARTIMDNMPIGLSVNSVDPEVSFTYMNDNFLKVYHTTREALSEPDVFWNVVYEDDKFRSEIKQRVLDDCALGDPEKMIWENVPITRDGQVVAYINATNTPVPDKDLMISTVWDVTDRIRAEEILKESYSILRLAGETAKFGGWSVDLNTNRVTWSDQVAIIHEVPIGYSPLVEEGIRFYAPEWREKITAVFTACAEEGVPYDEEMEIITSKGRKVWVRSTGEVVRDDAGKIIKVQGSFQDITDRKLAEEEIRKLNADLEQRVRERTAELEAVNKELESFAYSVSHDFRAPLRALDGFSASLTDKYSDQLDEQGLHYLDRIRKAAIYMSNLVDDLLKLSRVTRTELKKKRVNLSRMVSEALTVLQEGEPNREVEVIIAANLTAEGDPHLLRAAIGNLLDNAWKFSSNEEQAKIEVGQTNLEGEEVFFICDNGVGFNMAFADKLFGAFQRLHGVNEFPGTGIGLATVQRIVSRHGGRIWAESEVGKGATFYFTLPQ